MLNLRIFIAKYLLVYYLICYQRANHVAGVLTIKSTGGSSAGDSDALVSSDQSQPVAAQVAQTLSSTAQPQAAPIAVATPQVRVETIPVPKPGVENLAGSEAGVNIAAPAQEASQPGEGGSPSSGQSEKMITLVNPANLIELDVGFKDDTDYVDYMFTKDSINVFTAKDPYFFYKIVELNEVLWESKGEVYPKKVYSTLNAAKKTKLRLFYPKGTYISLDSANSFNLNVNCKEANDYYVYERNEAENLDSFKCKEGYKIRVLQKGPHILWSKDPSGKYSVEVMVFTMPNDKLAIVIYLEGGGRVMCYKDDPEADGTPKFKCEVEEDDITLVSMKSLRQYTPKSQTFDTAVPGLQLFTHGSSVPNDSTKFDHKKKHNRDIYTFKDGAICTQIKVGKDSLWKSSSDAKYPEKVTYYFNVLNISFKNGEVFIYMKTEDGWVHSYSMTQALQGSTQASQASLPKASPLVSSVQVKLDSEVSDDLEILDSRDQAKPRVSSVPSKSQQVNEAQRSGSRVSIDSSSTRTTVQPRSSSTAVTSHRVSTPVVTSTPVAIPASQGSTGSIQVQGSKVSQDSKSSDPSKGATPPDSSSSSKTAPTVGSQQVTTLSTPDPTPVLSTSSQGSTVSVQQESSVTTPVSSTGTDQDASSTGVDQHVTSPSTSPDQHSTPDPSSSSASGTDQDASSSGDDQQVATPSTSPDTSSSPVSTPAGYQDQEKTGSPESGSAVAEQGKTGSDQDQLVSGDQDDSTSTSHDQESSSSSGDQDSTSKGGQDQDRSTADQDKHVSSGTPNAGSTASTGGGQVQSVTPDATDNDDDLVLATSEGSSQGASGTSPPAIPLKRGEPMPAQSSSAPASTPKPKSRADAGSSATSRPTGGISISLDDDDDEVSVALSQNPERWTKVTALPTLSFYPLYKFVPSLEISTLDPNDSSKTVVNDLSSYQISHEKGNILYKFKSNTKCVLIKCENKVLWKHQKSVDQDAYPQYISLVSRFIFVVFDGYFKLYQKENDGFKAVFDSIPTLQQLNIYKTNENFYDYDKDSNAKIYIYKAKDKVLFNLVKKVAGCSCRSTPIDIWETNFPEYYASKVIRKDSGKKDKYLCVYYLNGNYSLFFKKKDAKFWDDETSDKFFSSDFRFHTLNEGKSHLEELEPSKRDVTLDGFIKRFKFEKGAKCQEIRCRNVKLWTHDKFRFGDDYPKEMTLNLLNNKVSVKLDALDFVYDYTGEDLIWKLNSVDMAEYYMARLTVVSVDENGANSSDNNTSRYDVNNYKTGLAYKIKDNSKFTEVKNGSKSLWKHDGKSDHPSMLYHDLKNNTLFIRFKDSVGICIRGEYRKVKVGVEAPKVDDLILVTVDDNGKRKENKVNQSSGSLIVTESPENETDDPTAAQENPSSDPTKINCNSKAQGAGIGKKNNTPDFTKETMDQGEKIHRLKFGEKVRCVELKMGRNVLWTHDLSKHGREYPKEIIVNLAMSTLTINFDSVLFYIYVHNGEKWVLDSENYFFDFYLGKFTLVTADDEDGKNSRDNDALEYSIEKQNNLFTLFVSDEAKCIKVKYEEQVVWSFSKEFPDSFAISVSSSPLSGALAIDTHGSSHKYTLEDGLWRRFDADAPLPPSSHPQGVTIITLEDESNNRVENDYNVFSVYSRGTDCYLYHFHEAVKCVEFKFQDRKIWGHHIKYKNNYPESISVDLISGVVEIEIGDKSLSYPLYPEE